ncbi:Uncharacterised protein [Mycobacteroides abscessus]|nr:Uncharacterised protein [Mycobacteroides abscessus]
MPTTRTAPSASARATASSTSGRSAGMIPLRPRPVSTARCTRAVRPAARAAATTSSTAQRAASDTSTSASTRSRSGAPGG